jgi:hypothetical protein
MAAKEMTEEQAVHLVRNALLVAGQEMGAAGDHWPVIKSTIYDIMKDFEDLKVERNVDVELKTHLYSQLAAMERGLANSPAAVKADVAPKLKKLREIYDAYFSTVDKDAAIINEDEIPAHMKRAKAIVATLEDENG